jgi:hypothetical protein
MATATGTIFDSLNSYTPSNTAQSGLAGQAAQQNIAAAPDIEALSQLINQINHQANQQRVTGGADLEAQSSQNIANELAGNLTNAVVANDQVTGAQRGAAGGFGVDSPNMNAAVLRAMNLQSMDIQKQGQADLSSAYSRAAPLFSAENAMLTPALLQKQQDDASARALQAQQIGDQAAEWRAQLAQRDKEFTGTIAQQQADLAARMGLSYAQMGEQARQFDVGQTGETTRLGLQLAATAAEKQAENTIQWAQMQQQQNQFTQNYGLQQQQQANQQSQYASTLANQQSQFNQTLQNNLTLASASADAKNYWDPRWSAYKSGGSSGNLPQFGYYDKFGAYRSGSPIGV